MIKVISPPHTKFAALHLVDQLNKLGHESGIFESVEPKDESLYIIYNAALLKELPKNYIVYQTEIPQSKWFNARYMGIIRKAKCVWDYNKTNTAKYRHIQKKIAIVSPGINPQKTGEKDIPALFYGFLKGSSRRQKLLKDIQQLIPVEVITDKHEDEMWDLLRRTKVVINLHYYDNSPLELFRIHEALSFGCHVVSEGKRDYPIIKFANSAQTIAYEVMNYQDDEFNYENLLLEVLDNSDEIKTGLKLIGL